MERDIRVIEAEAYVLPTLGSYTAWVDVNADEYGKRHGREANALRVSVYSPQPLSEGELSEISDAVNTKWQTYIFEREREFPGVRAKWARLMGGADLTLVGSEAGMDLAYGLGALGTFMASILFWGFMIFSFSIGGLIRSLVNYKRRRITKKLLDNWQGATAIMGEDPHKQMIVKDVHSYYSELDGKEIEIYRKMRDFCKLREYAPHKFYKGLVDRLEVEGETFLLQRYPPHFRRRLRNLLLGPKIEPPLVTAPMRVMPWEGHEA